ncbi:FunK1 protein kinase [Lineolata rhizophorae]|uniref:EKC/KEOPS complex subunit BUD32 n=1 Tax=Lineolata rhizophorae TaxID=578093 RepID=A0A6A6NSM4_9PEZI|nr:FunK1 protein kinase [Lineolata rhizophorae]
MLLSVWHPAFLQNTRPRDAAPKLRLNENKPVLTSFSLERYCREAEQSFILAFGPSSDVAGDQEHDFQDVISRLILALTGTRAAFHLRSKTRSEDVASELVTLFRRIRNDDFTYDRYRPLVKLVIDRKPDVEIWSAVFDLITTLSRATPPASVPAGFDDTPITHTSASQQGAEQTRKLVEERLFEEIGRCTYPSVEGFVEKHFEGKDWTPRALKIYKKIKPRYKDGRWTDFPDPLVQDGVVDWWFRFQDEFLSGERHRYYKTSSPKELTRAEVRRQIDLFVKRNEGPSTNTVHDLKDVKIIGELKESSKDKKGTLLHISRYIRDIFLCQPICRYIPAFTLCGREMQLWIFDRSGPYGPKRFDIHDEPERFIQVITGYLMMNDEELGLDTFVQEDPAGRFITLERGDESHIKLRLELSAFVHQRAIVCRGTSCFLAKTLDSESHNCVAKFSWTSDRRKQEADLLRLAYQRGVQGVANLVGHHQIASIADMRSGLTFGKLYPFRGPPSAASSSQSFPQSLQPSLASRSFSDLQDLSIARKPSKRSRSNNSYDHRTFRCLVTSPAGRSMRTYKSPLELLVVLRDAIRAHKSLYLTGNILHRDISENNIIITDPEKDGFQGVLIDLDLAKELRTGRSGARCRTGTMEFMAIEVLLGISHTYRHDLESFFYVLLWLCARRGWEKSNSATGQSTSQLRAWYTGNYEDIANAKLGHTSKTESGGLLFILREFPPEFDCVKPLCWELRAILFPYRDGLFTGTPKDPEVLYEPILRAFDSAVDDIKANEG